MEAEICACVSRLAATLKPEYAEALEAIEVAGTPVKAFAEQKGLSSNNAGVRVFRAREALKKRAEFLVQPSFSSPSARMLTRSGQPQRDCRT
jgi:DNA-directed RNA polymerase specialized sigma24 family protein